MRSERRRSRWMARGTPLVPFGDSVPPMTGGASVSPRSGRYRQPGRHDRHHGPRKQRPGASRRVPSRRRPSKPTGDVCFRRSTPPPPNSDLAPMLLSSLRISRRTLRRYRGTTAMNLPGLSVSLAVCVRVVLFVHQQWEIDTRSITGRRAPTRSASGKRSPPLHRAWCSCSRRIFSGWSGSRPSGRSLPPGSSTNGGCGICRSPCLSDRLCRLERWADCFSSPFSRSHPCAMTEERAGL